MLGVLLNARGERNEARRHWLEVVKARDDGLVTELCQGVEARRLLSENPEVQDGR